MTTSSIDPGYVRQLAVIAVAIAVGSAFIVMVHSFLIALILAAILSAIAYPLFRRINRLLDDRKGLAAATTVLFLIGTVALPGIALLHIVADQAQSTTRDAVPWIQKQIENPEGSEFQLPDWLPFRDRLQRWGPTIATKLSELSSKLGAYAVTTVKDVTSGAAQFFLDLFVMLYAMFYFLKEGPALLSQIDRYALLPNSIQRRIFQRALVVSRATIKGTLVIGLVQGFLGGIGFAIFGIQGAAFWGAVMAIASMLPVVGTSLIWVPGVLFLFASGETNSAIGLLLWSAVIVGNIDNILRPKLVGDDTEMSDLLVLISTFGGLAMFGGTGLILGPIIAAVSSTMVEVTYETLNVPSANKVSREEEVQPVGTAPAVGRNELPAPKSPTPPNETERASHGLLEVGLSDAERRELAELREQFEEIEAAKASKR